MNALQKVDTELSERYTTTCQRCGWVRQFFGTAKEARASAELMGWEFRKPGGYDIDDPHFMRLQPEHTYCPHCQLLTKETP